jgi:hypothetical protein
MQPSSDAPHLAQTVSGGTSAPVVACAAAGGVVATASATGMDTGGGATCPSNLAYPRAPAVPLAPTAARHDGCQMHVDISGRSAAAATQTRPPPPPVLFDDFSAWADDAYCRAHPLAPDQRLPLLPPPGVLRTQHHAEPSALPASMARTASGDAAGSPGVGAQRPTSQQRQQQQPRTASAAASNHRIRPSPSAVAVPLSGTPLHTCRICHRLIPGQTPSEQRLIRSPTTAAASGDGSRHGRSPAARSLEADVARALVSTLQGHPRPHSGSAAHMVKHATHRTHCSSETIRVHKAPCMHSMAPVVRGIHRCHGIQHVASCT